MKRCPLCGQKYADDANFCPMDAGKLVEDPVTSAATATAGDAASTLREPIFGGRFKAGPALGGGSTGSVFRAVDGESGAAVAIKTAPATLFASPLALDRTLREMRQLAKVASERIVKILDVGRSDAGGLYVAMELFESRSLQRMVQAEGPLSPPRAAQLALAIGEALLEAQKVGVIHRDVAPKNVLIDDGGRAKVINFGLAQPVTERVAGVPEFLSPEQGEGKPVDQRSNIYSLGAIFYFLLTGTPPFAGAAADVLTLHLTGELEPPSRRRPGIPAECDRAIAKAMEKQSSRRHLTLRQLLTELEPIAQSESVAGAAGERGPSRRDTIVQAVVLPPGAEATPAPGPASTPATDPAPNSLPPPALAEVPAPWQAQSDKPATAGPDTRTIVPGITLKDQDASKVREALAGQAPAPVAPLAATVALEETPLVRQAARPASPDEVSLDAAARPSPSETGPTTRVKPIAQVVAPVSPVAPVAPAPPSSNAAQAAPGPQGSKMSKAPKGKFRETMWFKKGELDEAAATAAAVEKDNEAATDALAAAQVATQDGRGLADRYQDDGSVAASERKKFSLKTGATQMMQAIKVPQDAAAGAGMSEKELAAELNTSGKAIGKLVLGALAIALAIAAIYFGFKFFGPAPKPSSAEQPHGPTGSLLPAAPTQTSPARAASGMAEAKLA